MFYTPGSHPAVFLCCGLLGVVSSDGVSLTEVLNAIKESGTMLQYGSSESVLRDWLLSKQTYAFQDVFFSPYLPQWLARHCIITSWNANFLVTLTHSYASEVCWTLQAEYVGSCVLAAWRGAPYALQFPDLTSWILFSKWIINEVISRTLDSKLFIDWQAM